MRWPDPVPIPPPAELVDAALSLRLARIFSWPAPSHPPRPGFRGVRSGAGEVEPGFNGRRGGALGADRCASPDACESPETGNFPDGAAGRVYTFPVPRARGLIAKNAAALWSTKGLLSQIPWGGAWHPECIPSRAVRPGLRPPGF